MRRRRWGDWRGVVVRPQSGLELVVVLRGGGRDRRLRCVSIGLGKVNGKGRGWPTEKVHVRRCYVLGT
jgi:hypothetical protein